MSGILFSSLLELTGMTPKFAAPYLNVRRRMIVRWMGGSEGPPFEVIQKLRHLHEQQQIIADEICDAWEKGGKKANILYQISTNDRDAQELGWPCRAAQVRAVAIAQLALAPVVIGIVDGATTEPPPPHSPQLTLFKGEQAEPEPTPAP